MKYSFIFVSQQGKLEIKSMLLAESLRRNLKCEYELIAAIPTPEKLWGKPGEGTIRFFDSIGVKCVPIVNHIDENYPIGNKVSCLLLDVKGDVKVFLDSDMLCLGEFGHSPEFEASFCAKPADCATFGGNCEEYDAWKKVYSIFGLEVPQTRMKATFTNEVMPPYFNAGLVSVRNGGKFGETWLECCKLINTDETIENKFPWLDQIALPVAISRLGVNYVCLDEKFNYPCHLRALDPNNLPILAHYHSVSCMLNEPILLGYLRRIAPKGSELYKAIRSFDRWGQVQSALYPSKIPSALRVVESISTEIRSTISSLSWLPSHLTGRQDRV